MVINPALLGGQAKDYLEDTSNLDPCSCQANIRAKVPETGYTMNILEAIRTLHQNQGDISLVWLRIRGKSRGSAA